MACWYCDPNSKGFRFSCARCRTVGISYAKPAIDPYFPEPVPSYVSPYDTPYFWLGRDAERD